VRAVFSRRTRIIGLGFCVLWALFFTGQFRPLTAFGFAHTAEELPRATVPQYLPWKAGRAVHVNQGNNGPLSHDNLGNRYAWDFGLPLGEPLYAGFTGVVEFALDGCPTDRHDFYCHAGWGNTVSVRAADGTCARFAHLSTVSVYPGMAVTRGTPIGTVGATGHATGPHLHYQREVCATGVSLPSRFVEAGVPEGGTVVTSAL
jgi:hypothetical protein